MLSSHNCALALRHSVPEADKLPVPSGALAALAVGSIHMACGCPYGLTLILFYMTASRLTKVGGKAKAALEEHYSEGGRRTATQARAPPRLLSTPCPEVHA